MAPIQKFHPLHLYFYRYCTKWRFLHLSPANLHMFVRIYLAFIFFDPQEKKHKYFVKTPTQNQEMLVVNGIARYLGNICVHPPSLHPNYSTELYVNDIPRFLGNPGLKKDQPGNSKFTIFWLDKNHDGYFAELANNPITFVFNTPDSASKNLAWRRLIHI